MLLVKLAYIDAYRLEDMELWVLDCSLAAARILAELLRSLSVASSNMSDGAVIHGVASIGHHAQLHLWPLTMKVICSHHRAYIVKSSLDSYAGNMPYLVNSLQKRFLQESMIVAIVTLQQRLSSEGRHWSRP